MFSHAGSVIQNILANYKTLDKNSKFHFFCRVTYACIHIEVKFGKPL